MAERYDALFRRLSHDLDVLEEEMKNDVAIDDEDVDRELRECAGIALKWSCLAIHAENAYVEAKRHVDLEVLPFVREQAREALENEDTKSRITKDLVHDRAFVHPTYIAATADMRRAEMIMNFFKKAEEQMKKRQFAIQSINKRQLAGLNRAGETMEMLKENARRLRLRNTQDGELDEEDELDLEDTPEDI